MATKPLTQTTGRRKEAVARARLRSGNGTHTINGKAFDVYFPTAMQRMIVTEALRVAEVEESYDVDATIHGGGSSGQAGALRMAIARSLVEAQGGTIRADNGVNGGAVFTVTLPASPVNDEDDLTE